MQFTLTEIVHAKELFAKDIGYHMKWKNPAKEKVARSMYAKFKAAHEYALKMGAKIPEKSVDELWKET